MVRTVANKLLILAVVVLLPGFCLAAFNQSADRLFLTTTFLSPPPNPVPITQVYNLDKSSSAWQLSDFITDKNKTIIDSKVFFNHLFLVVMETGKEAVYFSDNGLSFTPLNIPISAATLKISGNYLYIFDGDKSFQIDNQFNQKSLSGSPALSDFSLVQNGETPEIIAKDGSQLCFYHLNNLDTWIKTSLPSQNIPTDTTSLELFGKRIFARSSAGVYEVFWQSDQNPVLISADNKVKIISERGSDGIFISGSENKYSADSTSNWQSTTYAITTSFDSAFRTDSGHLLWQSNVTNNSASQYAKDGDMNNFQIVPSTWAKSAMIQDVSSFGGLYYLYLLNGSKNPNLYITTDFTKWSLSSLPSTATNYGLIADIRNLSDGNLVEATGTITTLPGVVSDGVIYIQDTTGGIQVYLSPTKGSLPKAVGSQITVWGTLKLNDAKRIILNGANDFILGHESQVDVPTIDITDASNYLGLLVKLKNTVSAVSSDYLTLDNFIRLHPLPTTQKFQINDTALFATIVDYNNSTHNVEAWATADGELLSRTAPVVETVSKTDNSINTVVSAETKTTSVSVPSEIVAADSTNIEPLVSGLTMEADPIPKVLPVAQNHEYDSVFMSIGSFLAGMIIVRGKRFQKI